VISALVSSLSVSARAADLAVRPHTKAPAAVPSPPYAWGGFYIGIDGGAPPANAGISWEMWLAICLGRKAATTRHALQRSASR
jgi:hypothetical protein